MPKEALSESFTQEESSIVEIVIQACDTWPGACRLLA